MTSSNPASRTRPSVLRSLSSSTLIPQKDKPRLYLALYPRGHTTSTFTSSSHCDSFHWALLVGPRSSARSDPGTRYHVLHTDNAVHPFLYEETEISTSTSHIPLVRITIAKVRSPDRLTALLRSLPIPLPENLETCLTWTRNAFTLLMSDKGDSASKSACLSTYLKPTDWDSVESRARKYLKKKRDVRRFDADHPGPWDSESVSTWNFWENRETTV
jgi:hypothetical protein